MIVTPSVNVIQRLREQVKGSIFTSGDADYEMLRRGYNLAVDPHPAAILVAADAQDVLAGVQAARDANLGVAVQLTGHGTQQPADDALLIVTSRLKHVEIDPAARTARIGAGVVWHEVVEAVVPHGLAPLLGSSPHVGVIGYTLGGGLGWLARRYGLMVDSVRSIDIVTADGVLRHASPTENRELLWGLRGGGGNFGVVTGMTFDLYPVATLYGGSLIYSGEVAAEALRFFRDWVKTIPDELTSSLGIFKFPNIPQMPEAIRGKTQVIVRAAYAGESAKGEALMRAWLDWKMPMVNTLHELPFVEVGTISNDPVNPAAVYGSNELFDELSDQAIDKIVRHATNSISPLVFAELRHAGGAIQKVDAASTAVGNRDAQFYFQFGGPIFPPRTKADSAAYIQQFRTDLQPYLRGNIYQNFMSGDETVNRAKDAYSPETYQRLLALKAQVDPNNLFRFSYQLVR